MKYGLAIFLVFVSINSHGDPRFQRIFTIILENANYSEAVQQPFIKALIERGALLQKFRGEAHPSQPNYIAMTSGSTHGVLSDGKVNLDVSHVGDLLENKNLKWRVYAEGYPGNCFVGEVQGRYVRKHVPFLSYVNVTNNSARCANITAPATLESDIASGSLPEYALYIPDMNNDGHDTDVQFATRWLSEKFGPLLNDPRFMTGTLFVLTFDESEILGGNAILTLMLGDSVQPGAVSNASLNNYSLLRLVEDNWALGNFGLGDQNATTIEGIWR